MSGGLWYALGVLTGGGLVATHMWLVSRAVRTVRARKDAEIAKLRTACERLQDDAGMMQRASDCADAYRKGKTEGRAHPMSDGEKFARTFEGKRVTFVDTTKRGA